MRKISSVLAVALGLVLSQAASAQSTSCSVNCFSKRWVYVPVNLSGKALTDNPDYVKVLKVIEAAKLNGYNGIALDSGGSGIFATMLTSAGPYPNFYTNYQSVVQKAQEAGIELIPVGGGPEVPAFLDPSQIEALPVQDLPFVVNGGVAKAVGTSIMTDSSFENHDVLWGRDTASVDYDNTVAHSGLNSMKFVENATSSGNNLARLMRRFDGLRPHTSYRMSFWVKTDNYSSPLRIQIYDPLVKSPIYVNRTAGAGFGWGTAANGNWNDNPNLIAKTQDWTRYDLDFNTANYSTVRLYMGTWANGTAGGKAWIDDLDIREIGLAHTIRRASLPVKVTSADGNTVYTENADYVIKPEALGIPGGSRIQPNQQLKVSYYQSAMNLTARYGTAATSCGSYFFDQQKALFDKISALFKRPTKYFLYYDEMRVLNWDPACAQQTAGAYLSNQIYTLQNTLTSAYPNLELYIWHDMFDPNGNATNPYYAVNGDLAGSWEGLKPSTVIMNWTDTTVAGRTTSLKFFSDKAFKQMIAVYYDDPSLNKVDEWLKALDDAQTQNVTGVEGFMYTTWTGNYDDLAKVANQIKARAPGRWPQ